MIDNIISYDSTKVWTIQKGNTIIFQKATSKEEVKHLMTAKDFLKGKSLTIDNKVFTLEVPNILDWEEKIGILSMSFCKGDNLEILLRTPSHRQHAILILHAIFNFILENNFYWYDFAPRNILIDDDKISFVDFEKGLRFDVVDLKAFLRNRVYEEYSSFLLKEERIFTVDNIFELDDCDKIDNFCKVEDIKIKRVQATAIALGYAGAISKEQYLNIYRMFLIAEEPFVEQDELIFPRIELEEILATKNINLNAYNDYALKIVKHNKKKQR